MIREQRNDVTAVAEHVLGKALQSFLRSNLNKHASARIIERG